MRQTLRKRSAFTLIELLVVIAIIAILAAILFPVFSQAREKARQSQCTNNFRNVNMAIQQYIQDYDELFPLTRPAPWVSGHRYIVAPPDVLIDFPPPLDDRSTRPVGWANSTQPYARNYQILLCPSSVPMDYFAHEASGHVANPASKLATSVAFNRLLAGYQQAGVINPVKVIALWEPGGSMAMFFRSEHSPAIVDPNDADPATFPNTYRAEPPCPPGTTSYMYVISWTHTAPSGAQWTPNLQVHTGGTVYSYADGHVKWQRNPGHWDQSPWAALTEQGSASSYWWSGCAPWLFRPIVQ